MTTDSLFVEATYDAMIVSANNVDGGPVVLGHKFLVTTDVWCTHGKFRFSTSPGGAYRFGIYRQDTDDVPDATGTGTLLGSQEFVSTPAGAWGSVELDDPIALVPGVVYCAVVQTDQGRYTATGGGFWDSDRNGANGLLDGIISGANPNPPAIGTVRNGVYEDDATVVASSLTFPDRVFNRAGYGVDLVVTDVEPGGDDLLVELAGTLAVPAAAIAVDLVDPVELAGVALAVPAAALSATLTLAGELAGVLGVPAAAIAVDLVDLVELAGVLGPPAAAIAVDAYIAAALASTLPVPAAAFSDVGDNVADPLVTVTRIDWLTTTTEA